MGQEGVSLPSHLPLTKVTRFPRGHPSPEAPPWPLRGQDRWEVGGERIRGLGLTHSGPTGRGEGPQEGPEENPEQAVGPGQSAAEEGVHRRTGEQVCGAAFLASCGPARGPLPHQGGPGQGLRMAEPRPTFPRPLGWLPVPCRTRNCRRKSRSWRGTTCERERGRGLGAGAAHTEQARRSLPPAPAPW